LAAVLQVVRIFEDWLAEDCEDQIKWPSSVANFSTHFIEPQRF
jgi:hypothetical protein